MPLINKKKPEVSGRFRPDSPFVRYSIPFVKNTSDCGFTLIELVITVAIASILIALVIPNLRPLVMSSRMTTQTNDIVSGLQIARSEAIKRASRVVVCTSSNGTACDGSGWSSGRLVFDASRSGTDTPSPLNTIRFHEPLPAEFILDSGTSFPDPIIFNAQGTPIQSNGRPLSDLIPMPVLLRMCDSTRSILGRQLALNGVGQLVTTKHTC
jgi:prepilin-type N-terminal cleavage/methylation domain-containing protein